MARLVELRGHVQAEGNSSVKDIKMDWARTPLAGAFEPGNPAGEKKERERGENGVEGGVERNHGEEQGR